MKVPAKITVTRTITYNTDELGSWTDEENSIQEVLDMILDWAVEDLGNAEIPIHMYDDDGNELPWEDIIRKERN